MFVLTCSCTVRSVCFRTSPVNALLHISLEMLLEHLYHCLEHSYHFVVFLLVHSSNSTLVLFCLVTLSKPSFPSITISLSGSSLQPAHVPRPHIDRIGLASMSQSSDSTVVTNSAVSSSPVESTVSTAATHSVSDNTVAPSRYNPYSEKTVYLKGTFDRKTALKVAHNIRALDCPYFPSDVVPPDEHANFLTLLQRRFPMDEAKQKECENWTKWSRCV